MPVVFGKEAQLPKELTSSEHLVHSEIEAIYFIIPRSQEIGRTLVSHPYALLDDIPHGAIPFGILRVKKNHTMILGGTFSWWTIPNFHQGLLDEVQKDLDTVYKSAFGSPRVKMHKESAPDYLIYWCEMPGRVGSRHVCLKPSEPIRSRGKEKGALFFPVALRRLCAPVESFHREYLIDPESFTDTQDARRLHLEDFMKVAGLANLPQPVLSIQPTRRERGLSLASSNGVLKKELAKPQLTKPQLIKPQLTDGATHGQVLARIYDAQH